MSGNRLRSARIQGGYKRMEDLAAAVRLPRFGGKVIGQVERGERPLYEHEAEALARVLPVEADWLLAGGGEQSDLRELLRQANEKLDAIITHLEIETAPEEIAADVARVARDASQGRRGATGASANNKRANPGS